MSFQINKSDFTVINSTDDWQPRPAIKEALSRLDSMFRDGAPTLEAGRTWISFDNIVGRTTIFATPIDMKTPDRYQVKSKIADDIDIDGKPALLESLKAELKY